MMEMTTAMMNLVVIDDDGGECLFFCSPVWHSVRNVINLSVVVCSK